jgi:hypothetical protein
VFCTYLFVALALNRKPPCIGNLDYINTQRERKEEFVSQRCNLVHEMRR